MRRLGTTCSALALSFLLGAGASQAQVPSQSGAYDASAALRARVSLEFRDAQAGAVLRAIAELVDCQAVVDPKVTRKVTITLRDVRLETALNAMCESIACRWRLEPGKLVFEPDENALVLLEDPDKLESLRVRDLDKPIAVRVAWDKVAAGSALRIVARLFDDCGLQVHDSRVWSRPVSLSSERDITLRRLLDSICAQAGCRWEARSEYDPKGTRRVLLVTAVR